MQYSYEIYGICQNRKKILCNMRNLKEKESKQFDTKSLTLVQKESFTKIAHVIFYQIQTICIRCH